MEAIDGLAEVPAGMGYLRLRDRNFSGPCG
jgi:hypothetical protein